jgi:predicted RecB family endonuclease
VQLSRTDARRIAVRAQLLDGIRPVVLAAKVTRELADLASWLDVDLLLPD